MYRVAWNILRQHYEDHSPYVMHVSSGMFEVAKARNDQQTMDEIRQRAEQVLTHSSTNVAALDASHTIFLNLKQWEQAAQCYALLVELNKHSTAYYTHCAAVAHLVSGNIEDYRKNCAITVDCRAHPADYNSRYLAAWTCLLSPDSGAAFDRVIGLAAYAMEHVPANSDYRRALAIAYYRAGHYHEAEKRLTELVHNDSGGDSQKLNALYARLFLAMTEHQLNRAEDAAATLRLAKQEADDVLQNAILSWDHRLVVNLWLDEAERVVCGDGQPDSAPNPSSPPGNDSSRLD
jgi:tetratricopeptide (TPR) repeat protein